MSNKYIDKKTRINDEVVTSTDLINVYNDGYLVCPICFASHRVLNTISINNTLVNMWAINDKDADNVRSITTTRYEMHCEQCGLVEPFFVDILIANAVVKLNKKGYKTQFSCSGHNMFDQSYILFAKEYTFDTAIKYWEISGTNSNNAIKYPRTKIEYMYTPESKKEYIDPSMLYTELNRWVASLPDISSSIK